MRQSDLHPTHDRDLAIGALAEALKPIPFIAPRATRVGELAVQEMFRSIIRDTHQRNPEPLPVAVLLHGDLTGMPLPELNAIVDDFLETSGIVFGIKDASVPEGSPLKNGEQSSIFHYMAVKTGGQYFAIPPGLYASALESIILQLHFRYQIGFKPSVIDGKRHRLRVIDWRYAEGIEASPPSLSSRVHPHAGPSGLATLSYLPDVVLLPHELLGITFLLVSRIVNDAGGMIGKGAGSPSASHPLA